MLKLGIGIDVTTKRFATAGVTYQPETTAYLNAVPILNDSTIYFPSTPQSILGSSIWTATDNCVIAIKNALGLTLGANNLSTKFKYIYPRIGTSAAMCSYNLTNGVSNGTYLGGWTFDSTGSLPNGVNGYFDTGIQCIDTNFVPASSSFGFYSKTNTFGTFVDIGVLNNTSTLLLYGRDASTFNSTRCLTTGGNNTIAITDSLGLLAMSRNNATTYNTYKNGVSLATFTDVSASAGVSTLNIFEASYNTAGSPGGQYSPRKRTWSFGGSSMTSIQMTNFYAALNNFETALNR